MHDSFLRQFGPLDEEEYIHLQKHFVSRTFAKGAVIVEEGSIQKELYFVEEGIQMAYYEDDKKLYVIAFTFAPGICAIPESFTAQLASDCRLVALTESKVLSITYDHLQKVLSQSHALEHIFRKMTEQVLCGVISRHIELHSENIESRFRNFASRSGHLLNKIPHKYIASYLGIDATNFSKLYNSIRL